MVNFRKSLVVKFTWWYSCCTCNCN